MQLSKNFELQEFLLSQTAIRKGIENEITPEHLESLKKLVNRALQPLREKVNRVIAISSGYRSEALNKAIGGSSKSQHCKGEAVDFSIQGMTSTEGCNFIIQSGIEFDQLIDEQTWIHMSYSEGKNRKEVLTATFSPNGVSYSKGLRQ
jgi:hypothetical protein